MNIKVGYESIKTLLKYDANILKLPPIIEKLDV